MKVLVACEESQAVCKAFRGMGHEAYSCDVQTPSEGIRNGTSSATRSSPSRGGGSSQWTGKHMMSASGTC